jgi:predicted metal-dependent phosphoesterase TrpH
MKVELHLHTSRHSECATSTPHELMRRLIECGYGAVYITEHDQMWDEWELADLRAHYPEILIFPGVEIALGENRSQHLVVLGTADRDYLRIPTAGGIIAHAREQHHLTILAHPFRWPTSPPEILLGPVLPDAVEHRTCNTPPGADVQAAEAAQRLGLPTVNTGDVHALEMTNRFWIETFEPLVDPDDIFSVVRSRAYRNSPENP